MASIKNLFTPKYRIFFDLFEEMGQALAEMATEFKSLSDAKDEKELEEAQKKVKDYELKCDKISHKMLFELNQNFITPFDREDVLDLINATDDIADHMNSTAKRIVLYQLFPLDEYVNDFIENVYTGVIEVQKGLSLIENIKNKTKINELINNIRELEEQADENYDRSITNLLNNGVDAVTLFKKQEIYQKLELITDMTQHVALVFESIVIKYG